MDIIYIHAYVSKIFNFLCQIIEVALTNKNKCITNTLFYEEYKN